MELMEHWKLLLPGILGLISPINCSVSPPAFLSTIQWPHYSRLGVGRLFPKMSQVVNILAFVSHGRSLFHVLLCERFFFFFNTMFKKRKTILNSPGRTWLTSHGLLFVLGSFALGINRKEIVLFCPWIQEHFKFFYMWMKWEERKTSVVFLNLIS